MFSFAEGGYQEPDLHLYRADGIQMGAYELVGDRTVRFQHDEMAMAYRMAAVAGPIADGQPVRSY